MDEELLELLSETPKSRSRIARELGTSERQVESIIARLRDRGESICSNSDTVGYWVDSGADLERTIREMEHRAVVLLNRAKNMRNRKDGKQVTMDEFVDGLLQEAK